MFELGERDPKWQDLEQYKMLCDQFIEAKIKGECIKDLSEQIDTVMPIVDDLMNDRTES